VPPKISTLSESLMTEGTFEGSHASMLPEVVSKITTFFENTPAVWISTLEV